MTLMPINLGRYPAGVSASNCLDYPYCTNNQQQPLAYASVPATGAPAASVPVPAAPLAPVSADPSLAYPAGVSASVCIDYPYCSQGPVANPALRYPAGVSASLCINYPFCDI